MYPTVWDLETGGVLFQEGSASPIALSARPVFHEELDLLELGKHWNYPKAEQPLLWAVGRKYFYRGEVVAEVSGGGFFTNPRVTIHRRGLDLVPVDLDKMIERNQRFLQAISQRSLEEIQRAYAQYHKRVDAIAVAFSGGKDSVVLLDLAQRVLDPDQFIVVFNDTWMELSDTYQLVQQASQHWSHLTFLTARSRKDALTMWKEMGPPSRLHRWCCTVHKSAPTLMLLREVAGKPSVRALVFDGVRHEEGARRASYGFVSEGKKQSLQVNASPILRWSSIEVFLYIWARKLVLNNAYRNGLSRVGCIVCPFSSGWSELLIARKYGDEARPFLEFLLEYGFRVRGNMEASRKYVDEGRWKTRAGGAFLGDPHESNLVTMKEEAGTLVIELLNDAGGWSEWLKTLGRVSLEGGGRGRIEVSHTSLNYLMKPKGSGWVTTFSGLVSINGATRKAIRSLALKAAYCAKCDVCETLCPKGALRITEAGAIVDDSSCGACGACLTVDEKRSCLRASSIMVTSGGATMRAEQGVPLRTYEGFGLRQSWLREVFELKERWPKETLIGNRQADATFAWLKDAEILASNSTRTKTVLSELGEYAANRGVNDLLVWAAMWCNLAVNSPVVRWYVTQVPWGVRLTKSECEESLADWCARQGSAKSERTIKNATNALFGLLRDTPLGGEMMLGIITKGARGESVIFKSGWRKPTMSGVLYSMYKYAEARGRFELSASELYAEGVDAGPYACFGVPAENMKSQLRALDISMRRWVRAELVRDLDNIYLNPSASSIEVFRDA